MDYPYFINPDIDALPGATGEERVRLIRRIAANVGDEATLRTILGIDPEEFRSFYPDMTPPDLSTAETISSFIDRFAADRKSELTDEMPLAAPAIDYAAMIADDDDDEAMENMEADETADAISAFLDAVPPKTPKSRKLSAPGHEQHPRAAGAPTAEIPDAGEAGGSLELSESLFRMMVKNKNYAKALEIITELNLNNPKKSVYFAHQKRFLEKLVALGQKD